MNIKSEKLCPKLINKSAKQINNQNHSITLAKNKIRNEHGVQLVELLIAVTVITFFMAGILDGLAQMHQQTTAPQHQTIAANLAQELIDSARNETYTNLLGFADGQWHDVLVNRTTAGQVATGQPAYLNRQLMLDLSPGSGMTYSNPGQNNLFRGTVQQRLTDLGNNQIQLSIQVTWPSEMGPGNRSLNCSTIISRFGIHNY